MRTLSTLALALLVGCLLSPAAPAQVRVVPYAGYAFHAGFDVERVFSEPRPLDATGGVLVGIGAEFPILTGRFPFALSIRPTAETAFVPGTTETFEGFGSVEISQRFFQVGGEVIAAFAVPGAPLTPFVGVGLSYARYAVTFDEEGDVDVVGNSDVDAWALGPALVGGLRFGSGRIVPLVQARYSFTNPSPSFSGETDGSEIGNGIAVMAGASIGL